MTLYETSISKHFHIIHSLKKKNANPSQFLTLWALDIPLEAYGVLYVSIAYLGGKMIEVTDFLNLRLYVCDQMICFQINVTISNLPVLPF